MWRDAFPRATDRRRRPAAAGSSISARAYTSSRATRPTATLLTRSRQQYAPEGFDVIIDDASHMGITSARSLQHLYRQHLRAGGTYVIEDWGTGYVPTGSTAGRSMHPSGSPTSTPPRSRWTADKQPDPDAEPRHRPGRVDQAPRRPRGVHAPSPPTSPTALETSRCRIEWMRVHDGLVVLRKPALDSSWPRGSSRSSTGCATSRRSAARCASGEPCGARGPARRPRAPSQASASRSRRTTWSANASGSAATSRSRPSTAPSPFGAERGGHDRQAGAERLGDLALHARAVAQRRDVGDRSGQQRAQVREPARHGTPDDASARTSSGGLPPTSVRPTPGHSLPDRAA